MPQTFTADCFASGHAGQTDLAAMENNFLALKSHFSGTGAPSNPVAGIDWYDTTSHIYKMRNEANDAWLDFYNLATGRAADADKCTGITLQAGTGISITHPELSANPTISHAAHTGHVTGTQALTIANGVITPAMLAAYAAGDALIIASDGAQAATINTTTWTKAKEVRLARAGTLRISYILSYVGGHIAYSRIYRNGTAVGTEHTGAGGFTEDISGWSSGDLCQVYARSSDDCVITITCFRLYATVVHHEVVTLA